MGTMTDQEDRSEALLELTADIVSAYVANNPIPAADLPSLIGDVRAALGKLSTDGVEPAQESQKPAVNPKRSIHDEHLICLEDGKKFKSLKRHLFTHHGMTPDEYRTKWNLSADYPMVAPGYSAARSELAKQMGLGRKPSSPEPVATAAKRGRKPKTA
jgi:predicted transcriptional regulator